MGRGGHVFLAMGLARRALAGSIHCTKMTGKERLVGVPVPVPLCCGLTGSMARVVMIICAWNAARWRGKRRDERAWGLGTSVYM